MTEKKTYPRPDSKMPRVDQKCPLCGAPPYMAHRPSCPWQKWAESWLWKWNR